MMRHFIFILLVTMFFLPRAAFSGESLVGSEAVVDVTGKDPADARAKAMAKGEIDALMDLLSKLSSPSQAKDIMAGLDAKKIAAMVRSADMAEEKVTGNHYQARLIVNFDGDAISQLVSSSGNASADQPPATTAYLILPEYEEGGQAMLWETSNPWRNIWRIIGLETSKGDIVVPYGDRNDEATVDAKTLPTANYATLASMVSRYGVSDIVALQAVLVESPELTLNVTKRRLTRTRNEVTLMSFHADPQENRNALLTRAAREIAGNLQRVHAQEAASAQKMVEGGEHHQQNMVASITTLNSWTQLRAKLSGLPMVDQLDMLAITPQQVDFTMHYRGTPDALARALVAAHVRLQQHNNYWSLSKD